MEYLKYKDIKKLRELNTPELCPILMVKDNKYVLDHDHQSGLVRGVISNEANLIIGKLENAIVRYRSESSLSKKEITYNIYKYIARKPFDILHPVGLKQKCSAFRSSSKDLQKLILLELGLDESNIFDCVNAQEREKLFRKALTKDPLNL